MSITQTIFARKNILAESVELDSIETQDNGDDAVVDNTVEKFEELSEIIQEDNDDELVTEAVAIADACCNAITVLIESYAKLEESMTLVLTESADLDDAKETISIMTEAALSDVFASLVTRLRTIVQNMSVFVTNAFIKSDSDVRGKMYALWIKKNDVKNMKVSKLKLEAAHDYMVYDWDLTHPLMISDAANNFIDIINSNKGIPNTTDTSVMDRVLNNKDSGAGAWDATNMMLFLLKHGFNQQIKDMVKDSSIIATMDNMIKRTPISVSSSSFNANKYVEMGIDYGLSQNAKMSSMHNELKRAVSEVNKMINDYEKADRKNIRGMENLTNEEKSLLHSYHSKRVMFMAQSNSLSIVIYMKRISLMRQFITESKKFMRTFLEK